MDENGTVKEHVHRDVCVSLSVTGLMMQESHWGHATVF